MYPTVYDNVPWLTKSPNVFLFKNTLPGIEPNKGPWTKEEQILFISLLGKYGPGNWGVFSTQIPGRVGYQCAELYVELVKNGVISCDNNTLLESMDSVKQEELTTNSQNVKLVALMTPKKEKVEEDINDESREEDLFDDTEEEIIKKQKEIIITNKLLPMVEAVNPKEQSHKRKALGEISPYRNRDVQSSSTDDIVDKNETESLKKKRISNTKKKIKFEDKENTRVDNGSSSSSSSTPKKKKNKKKQKVEPRKSTTLEKSVVQSKTKKIKSLNIYEDPEIKQIEVKSSSEKVKRKPFQPINRMTPMSYSFELGEGISIVDDTKDKGAVYLGNMDVAQNLQWLKDSEIKAIVNAASEVKNFYPSDFQYKKLSIMDSSDFKISKFFDEVVEFIDEYRTKGSVLVHCQKGQSRSVTLIFAYLIKSEGWTLADVCNFFETQRIKTTMNIGFQQQIMIYERKITRKNTKDFFAKTPRLRRTPQKYSPQSGKTASRIPEYLLSR